MARTIELKLTGIAHGGEALGKVGKRIVFVAFALPGEVVRVELIEEHQRWARGRLIEVLQPSPGRVEPGCPYFGLERCGGCQWQHIDRSNQLDYKRRIVQDQLQRVAGLRKPKVNPTRGANDAWGYRSHMLFYPSGEGSLGLRKGDSYDVLPIDVCPLMTPGLRELYDEFNVEWDGLRSVGMSVSKSSGERLVTLRTRGDEAPEIEVDVPVSVVLERSDDRIQPLIGSPWYFETIAGHEFRLSAGIRQPFNIEAMDVLAITLLELLELRPGHVLMDVYNGSGIFTRALAEKCSMVIGIDEDDAAMEDCAFNCSDLDNVILHEGPPPKVLRKLQDSITHALVSAPKEGMGHRIAQNLARMGARRLAYVAQNPVTLARDVEQLTNAGYRFMEAIAIDVAPQTYYMTTVALFTR